MAWADRLHWAAVKIYTANSCQVWFEKFNLGSFRQNYGMVNLKHVFVGWTFKYKLQGLLLFDCWTLTKESYFHVVHI